MIGAAVLVEVMAARVADYRHLGAALRDLVVRTLRHCGMAKSDVAVAIDELLRDVLVGPLKAMGFRRRGRRWTHDGADTLRTVEVQASQWNSYPTGSFRVGLQATFPQLELDRVHGQVHPLPATFACDLGAIETESAQRWYDINAKAQLLMDRASRQLADDWTERGQALIEAMADPARLLDHLQSSASSVRLVLNALGLAQLLGDRDLEIALARRAAHVATGRTNWRTIESAHPLEEGLAPWAMIVEEFGRLGLELDPAHVRAASAVIDDASAGKLSTGEHQQWDEENVEAIARAIGRPVPPIHRVAREPGAGRW